MTSLPYLIAFACTKVSFHYSQVVERSRSATPYDPYDPTDPKEIAEDQNKEKESYEALIKDNGRPCYPIEIGFDVFETPGHYKDIVEYWQQDNGPCSKRLVYSAQLTRWKSFRAWQHRTRRSYVPRNRFPQLHEQLRDCRRKHGLDGDVHLREVAADQSKLEDWTEYQVYELFTYEKLKESLKKSQERLAANRKALAEDGYSAFEEIEDMEFGQYYGMNLEWHEKEAKAKKQEELAERKLKIAKARMEAAQSEEIGDSIGRDQWIGWFVKKVESQRARANELKHLAHKARQDVEPYDRWWEAKRKEWERKGWDDFTEEGHRLIELETSSAEYRTQFDKMQELNKRAHQARFAHFRAEDEVEFAEELLEAAQTEDLTQTVERAALIRRIQKEVRFAEFHVAEENESTKVLDLKTRRLDNLYSITSLNRRLRQHEILLSWIEQQRQELVNDNAGAVQRSGLRRSTRASTRATHTTEASKANYSVKKRIHPPKRSTAKSILDPTNPAKVNKASRKRQGLHQSTANSRRQLQAAENVIADSKTAEPGKESTVPIEDGMCAHSRPVHLSRVSKTTPKRPTRQQKAKPVGTRDAHRRTRNHPLDTSSALSRNTLDSSMDTSP